MNVPSKRPSPAIVVAVCALAFAMVGTAIAGTDGLNAKITKAKVKKIAKKQIKKAAPGLSVAKAVTADTATTATNATNADTATVAGNVRYAFTGDSLAFGPADTDQTVQSVNLPAGVWAVTAKVIPNNNAATPEEYDCHLLVGGTEVDRTSGSAGYPAPALDLAPNGAEFDRAIVALTGAATLAAPGTADLVCQATTDLGNYLARPMMAIRVATLNG